jgi:hypothetical protein
MKILKSYKITFILLIVVSFALVSVVNAQNARKKRRSASRTIPVQTVPAPTTEPVIVSRAEDYPIGDAVLSPAIENALRSVDQVENNPDEKTITELTDRIKALEAVQKDEYDVKQKRLAMNLEILIKAEQRAESLRKQSFDLLEKENSIKTKLEQIENDLRPESIDRSLAFVGSLRPEELRAARKKSLEAERSNLQTLLVEIQRTRTSVDTNVLKADQLVDRLRVKLEADIDTSLEEKPTKP